MSAPCTKQSGVIFCRDVVELQQLGKLFDKRGERLNILFEGKEKGIRRVGRRTTPQTIRTLSPARLHLPAFSQACPVCWWSSQRRQHTTHPCKVTAVGGSAKIPCDFPQAGLLHAVDGQPSNRWRLPSILQGREWCWCLLGRGRGCMARSNRRPATILWLLVLQVESCNATNREGGREDCGGTSRSQVRRNESTTLELAVAPAASKAMLLPNTCYDINIRSTKNYKDLLANFSVTNRLDCPTLARNLDEGAGQFTACSPARGGDTLGASTLSTLYVLRCDTATILSWE